MNVLLISDVEKILESYSSQIKKEPIIVFLNAINDWPTNMLNFEDYEIEVSKFINGITSKNNISIALASIDVSKNAWECESLTQILDVFTFYPETISLKEIILDFKMQLSK